MSSCCDVDDSELELLSSKWDDGSRWGSLEEWGGSNIIILSRLQSPARVSESSPS